MKLMMVCPRCNGEGWHERGDLFKNIVVGGVCTKCHGVKFIDPPQQVLDDLECAKIERELGKLEYGFSVDSPDRDIDYWDITIYVCGIAESFVGATKLEALRKAKEWIEGEK